MKKIVAVLLYLLVVAASRESGMKINPALPTSDKALDKVREMYSRSLADFEQAVAEFVECVEGQNGDPRASCRTNYRELRDRYKEIEILLEYRDEASVRMFFNGAPLLSLEPHVPEIVVLHPEGMQVLDELMHLGEGPGDQEAIHEIASTLHDRTRTMIATQRSSAVQHHHVWNGMRVAVIRLYTLGLTGFDTPGSAMAIEDAGITMRTFADYINAYSDLIEDSDSHRHLHTLLGNARSKLADSESFETFDRLAYLTEVINPLFSALLDVQTDIGIALPDETDDDLPAINLRARSLFDESLYNLDYYTNMVRDDVSKEKVDLGRVLFFDPVLSRGMSMSCASCHNPDKAFTDGKTRSASGIAGKTVARNAPTLIDCVFSERFFLDMREEQIERQVKHVVLDSLEFNNDFMEIVDRLSESSEYRDLFAEAYPGSKYQLSKWSVSDALAAYVASLVSFNSPVDKYIRGEITELDPQVYNGFNLFMGKAACGSCHFAPAFNGTLPPFYQHTESEVLGVPVKFDTANATVDPDMGRIASSRPTDESYIYLHSFKTSTVRNVELTAPYMHNGAFETLEDVIDFYNRGGGAGIGIDLPNQTLPDVPLDLTEAEVNDLVMFMHALTDTSGLTKRPDKLPEFERRHEWNERTVGGMAKYK